MKNRALFLLALALVSGGAPAAAAGRATQLRGPVYANWHEGVKASRLSLDQPILLTPVAFRDGVAQYALRGTVDGVTDRVLVRVPFDPTARPERSPRGAAHAIEKVCASDSPRCDVPQGNWSSDDSSRCEVELYVNANYDDFMLSPEIDLNTLDFTFGTNLNDKVTSLKTHCNPVYFFEHKNWGGTSLYVPANTNLSNLVSQSFNDKASSLYHVLP